jgi:hypothetical protein
MLIEYNAITVAGNSIIRQHSNIYHHVNRRLKSHQSRIILTITLIITIAKNQLLRNIDDIQLLIIIPFQMSVIDQIELNLERARAL